MFDSIPTYNLGIGKHKNKVAMREVSIIVPADDINKIGAFFSKYINWQRNDLSNIIRGGVHRYQQGNLACTLTSKAYFDLEV